MQITRRRYMCRMKLEDYLAELGTNQHAFSLKHKVSYFAVYRHLLGKPISYANAKRISVATAGAVTIADIME